MGFNKTWFVIYAVFAVIFGLLSVDCFTADGRHILALLQ